MGSSPQIKRGEFGKICCGLREAGHAGSEPWEEAGFWLFPPSCSAMMWWGREGGARRKQAKNAGGI